MDTRTTQYDRLLSHLVKVRDTGATYLSLSVAARCNCPWKRLGEMEERGYRFERRKVAYKGRQMTVVKLAGRPRI